MIDLREAILARLAKIADEDIEDIVFAARNQNSVTDRQVPAIVVLEGDEETSPSVHEARHRPTGTPIPMVMIPEMCIIGLEETDKVGTVLNDFRAKLIKAVIFDEELLALIGANGAIEYRGLVSDLGLGRAMTGRMALRFAITYILKPSAL